jgi:hypothetical protein
MFEYVFKLANENFIEPNFSVAEIVHVMGCYISTFRAMTRPLRSFSLETDESIKAAAEYWNNTMYVLVAAYLIN